MKILVTGAGGFLGGAIVRALCIGDNEVHTLQRGDYPALQQLKVTVHRGDVADREAVGRAGEGCEVVFHVAAKAGVWGDYQDYYRSNVLGTKNVLEACRQHGTSRLIYTSSPSIVFDGEDEDGINESAPYSKNMMTHYQRTKAEAERLVLAANNDGLGTVALRPHLIFGPGDPHLAPRIIERAKSGSLRLPGKCRNLVDITYIDNAVAAHLAAMDRLSPGAVCAGKAYFISNDEPLMMSEIVNRILAAAGMPPVIKTVTPEMAYCAGVIMELVYTLFRVKTEPFMTRFIARQLAKAHWYDISAAKHELGYTPVVSIDEGMQRLKQSLMQNDGMD